MKNIKTNIFAIVILTLAILSCSVAFSQSKSTEKEIMIVYVLSATKTLRFHYSINGKEYKEEDVKRKERRDFNAIVIFLKSKYAEGWTLKSSNMSTGTTYEEFYYMLEK